MRSKKRLAIIATSVLGLAALFGAVFMVNTNNTHAATDPHFLTDDSVLQNGHAQFKAVSPNGHTNGQGHTTTGIQGVDSIPNWNDHFFENGYDANGNPQQEWFTNTVGTLPNQPGTTTINAPVIPVTVKLAGPDGSIMATYDPSQYMQTVLNSPIFQNSTYSSSSTPTQYTDAVQRAEFYSKTNPDWHTMLNAQPESGLSMTVPYGMWKAHSNPDGTCCRYILIDYDTFSNLLFPATPADQSSTVIGQAELSGMITTKDISTFLFPNTFLYGSFGCCVLGFHGPDIEPGDASNGNLTRAYMIDFASWTSRGLFGYTDDAPQDVTPLSHELSETFNDPFVTMDNIHDVTPFWQSSFNCQNNLEDGDVIEGLPKDNTVINMNGFNYHVQNEALVPWFEGQTPSSAIDGAYSYPDTTTLTSAAVSMTAGCTGPAVP